MLRPYRPSTHVPDIIDRHILQARIPEHFGNARPARCFRPRGRWDRGQRGLAAERRFVRVLDVCARGAHAFVEEDGVDHISKL